MGDPCISKTPGWLDWCASPSKPDFNLPAGSIDAHCHVFGPAKQFPFAPERKYTPCDASKHDLFALRDHLGFSRNILVQATCHGTDNSAVLDAIAHSGGRARGVASVAPNITDDELKALHDGGIRGVRFNFVKRLVDPIPLHTLWHFSKRLSEFGWHIVVYFEAEYLDTLFDFMAVMPVPIIIDHMGRPDLTAGVTAPLFQRFLTLIDHSHIYTKVTCPERLSVTGPPTYDDFIPIAQAVIARSPERVIWGTDWPHPNLKSHMPDDAWLVDLIPQIAPDPGQQNKLLVDNPMKLYWPEEVN